MSNSPRKAVVLILDNMSPALVQKYMTEGRLPSLQKLADRGAALHNCLAPYPATGPACHASIATGAWPGTHNITGFPSDAAACKAQYLWEAADQTGRKCIVLNFHGAERSNLQHGIILRGPERVNTPVTLSPLTAAATELLSKNEWDLFFLQSVLPTAVNENSPEPYLALDRMLTALLDLIGRETLITVVSTPGATAGGSTCDVAGILARAGLTIMHNEKATRIIDASQSKCLPQSPPYIQINLKGRSPAGIIEPGDYDKVRQDVIDALLTFTDPATGIRPVTLALSKEDARLLGLYGENIGDVVYALDPRFASPQLADIIPSSNSLKCWLTFTGPGIKKGAVIERTCSLADIVPTLCYLMNWPLPEQSEGAIIYQALRNPNSIVNEMAKMEDALYRMNYAEELGERQAWDRHWSAGKYDRLFPTDDK